MGAQIKDFVLITRLNDRSLWRVVANPRWDKLRQEGVALILLENPDNVYVEYENSGCVYRVIRAKDLQKYVED